GAARMRLRPQPGVARRQPLRHVGEIRRRNEHRRRGGGAAIARARGCVTSFKRSMIPKSGYRFSEKIMLQQKGSVGMSEFGRAARRRFLAAAAGFAAALAMANAACAQDAFKFGLAMPLTGSQALYGQDQVKAAEWAVAEINKAGGVNGKKLDMIVLDT